MSINHFSRNLVPPTLILILVSFTWIVSAQQLPDRKKNADRLYKTGNYALAIPLYKSLLKGYDLMNPDLPIENLYLLADCYRLTRSYSDAEYWYSQAVLNHKAPNLTHFYFGESLQHNGRYKEAKTQFQLFKPANKQDSVLKSSKIESCNRSIGLKIESRPIIIKNVKELNTRLSDFGLIISQNDFYFVSNGESSSIPGQPKNRDSLYGWTNEPYWHLYVTRSDKNRGFAKPAALNKTINSKYHTGPAVINQHGDVMFFTQANADKRHDQNGSNVKFRETVNNNQIFVSIKLDGQWQKPIPCYFNNASAYSVEHPALSKDEKTLYFASDMPGGFGGMDLYSVDILGGGMYGIPKNLGDSVNSPGDEVFPSIGPDGVLYYSSNGKIGYGGLDIFQSTKKGGKWTTPLNLGKPLNSNKDDFLIFFTDASKHRGYFSSNRDGGMGEDDIYSFEEMVPLPVQDSTKTPTFVYLKRTNPKVLDTIANFFKADTSRNNGKKNLVLHSILYQTGRAEVRKTSLPILNQIAEYLRRDLSIRLLIKGFTDNKGTASKNLLLSAARANNIRDYFIARGVDGNRLESEGYGSSQPIALCPVKSICSEKQNQVNRRTEFSFIR